MIVKLPTKLSKYASVDEVFLAGIKLLEDYLIFYRLVSEGIEVMRVVVGYRYLEALFVENDED